jgi:hypothetical protein
MEKPGAVRQYRWVGRGRQGWRRKEKFKLEVKIIKKKYIIIFL